MEVLKLPYAHRFSIPIVAGNSREKNGWGNDFQRYACTSHKRNSRHVLTPCQTINPSMRDVLVENIPQWGTFLTGIVPQWGISSLSTEGLDNAYIVKDDIETGFGNIIPLWCFGLNCWVPICSGMTRSFCPRGWPRESAIPEDFPIHSGRPKCREPVVISMKRWDCDRFLVWKLS